MTPWPVAYQPSRSMGFSRQEYWSGLNPGPCICPFCLFGDCGGICFRAEFMTFSKVLTLPHYTFPAVNQSDLSRNLSISTIGPAVFQSNPGWIHPHVVDEEESIGANLFRQCRAFLIPLLVSRSSMLLQSALNCS